MSVPPLVQEHFPFFADKSTDKSKCSAGAGFGILSELSDLARRQLLSISIGCWLPRLFASVQTAWHLHRLV